MKLNVLNRITFLALVCICLFMNVFAKADGVDEIVKNKMSEAHIPGVAIAVVKNGVVVKRMGYGVASVEFDVPVSTETVFEIGAVTKQITATGIMLLVEDGKINLDEKISKYLEETPAVWEGVTVRQLLTHTSGIKSYTRIGGFELANRFTAEEFIGELGTLPLDFPPGSEFRYSDSGYNLLGFIIEFAAEKTYWEFLQESILLPLRMNQTANRDPQFIIKGRATGYEWQEDHLVGRDYELTDLFSAGAIVSTADDLASWVIALDNKSLLKAASRDEIRKPFILSSGKENQYGFGWNIVNFRGKHILRHSGQTAGFSANISRYVDSNLSIVVLTNLGTRGLASDLALGIAKHYIPSLSLKALKPSTTAGPAGAETIGTFLNNVLQNEFNADVLTDDLIIKLSTERAMANHKRILSFGKISKIDLIDMRFSGDRKIYRYRVKTGKRLMLWSILLTKGGKISDISLLEEE